MCALEILKLKISVITLYCPPRGDFVKFLEVIEQLLSIISKINKYCILNGDFNVHFNIDSDSTNRFTYTV